MPESYFIAKLYRQHNSTVMAVPKAVMIALGLKPGNHVVLQWNNSDGKFEFSKFVPVGAKDGRDTEHTDNQDRSRAAPAEIRG